MGVQIEMGSIIINLKKAAERKNMPPSELSKLIEQYVNGTGCSDGWLLACSFMNPMDRDFYLDRLKSLGVWLYTRKRDGTLVMRDIAVTGLDVDPTAVINPRWLLTRDGYAFLKGTENDSQVRMANFGEFHTAEPESLDSETEY